ncbi:hypothetical protein D3C77_753820 [compost metagenome]
MLAVILAITLQPLLAQLPVPGLTAPYILACWLVLIGQRLMHSPLTRRSGRLHS